MGRKRIQRRTEILTWVIMVMIFILALGMGIRKLWMEGVFSDSQTIIQTQADRPDSRSATEANSTQTDPNEPDEQFLTWLQEEMEKSVAREQSQEYTGENGTESATQQIQSPVEEIRQASQMSQSFGNWRNVWSDLDLTEGEISRLREGWTLAVARWQNMSPEERQFQQERMRASWEKWQNMSEEERTEASQELRGRFEEWRRSGDTELPDMILD